MSKIRSLALSTLLIGSMSCAQPMSPKEPNQAPVIRQVLFSELEGCKLQRSSLVSAPSPVIEFVHDCKDSRVVVSGLAWKSQSAFNFQPYKGSCEPDEWHVVLTFADTVNNTSAYGWMTQRCMKNYVLGTYVSSELDKKIMELGPPLPPVSTVIQTTSCPAPEFHLPIERENPFRTEQTPASTK